MESPATADPLFQQHGTWIDSIHDDLLEHISFLALWYHSWPPGICVFSHISIWCDVSLQKNDNSSKDCVVLMIRSYAKDHLPEQLFGIESEYLICKNVHKLINLTLLTKSEAAQHISSWICRYMELGSREEKVYTHTGRGRRLLDIGGRGRSQSD